MAVVDDKAAQAIRAARAIKRQTQREASDEIGVHVQTFASWEKGAARPAGESLNSLEEWLGDDLPESEAC